MSTNAVVGKTDRIATAMRMKGEGRSVADIATHLEVSTSTVRRYLASATTEAPAEAPATEAPAESTTEAPAETPAEAPAETGRMTFGVVTLIPAAVGGLVWDAHVKGKRVGDVVEMYGRGYLPSTVKGRADTYAETLADAAAWIASAVTGTKAGKPKSALATVRTDLRNAARARNQLRLYSRRLHIAATETLPKRHAARMQSVVNAAHALALDMGRDDLDVRHAIAVRGLRDAELLAENVADNRVWVRKELEAMTERVRELRARALKLDMSQAEVEKIMAGVKAKDARDAEYDNLRRLFARIDAL